MEFKTSLSCSHQQPITDSILRQKNLVHIIVSYFFQSILILPSHLHLALPALSLGFWTKLLNAFHPLHIPPTSSYILPLEPFQRINPSPKSCVTVCNMLISLWWWITVSICKPPRQDHPFLPIWGCILHLQPQKYNAVVTKDPLNTCHY
jgi:hypothetical protein